MSLALRRARAPATTAPGRAEATDRTEAADAAAAGAVVYVGLVTRALAFALDSLLVNVVAIITAAVFALTFSVVSLPDDLRTFAVAAGGVLYVLWAVGYFVTFWATTGQTPGSRALGIEVRAVAGGRLKPRRAVLRFAGLTLAALPLFAGFLLILVDDRRRGLHDRLARTVVIDAPRDAEAPHARGRPPATPRA